MGDAATPIADVVHERLLELDCGLAAATVEQVALAIIAGAGRFLLETTTLTRAELNQAISQAIGARESSPARMAH